MAVQVNQPGRRQGSYSTDVDTRGQTLSRIGTIGGAVIGGVMGGPGGALAGSQIGGGIGSTLGSLIGGGGSETTYKEPPPQAELLETGKSDALARRMEKLKTSDLSTIREGIDSLKYIDDQDTRLALAKPLLKAEYMAKG